MPPNLVTVYDLRKFHLSSTNEHHRSHTSAHRKFGVFFLLNSAVVLEGNNTLRIRMSRNRCFCSRHMSINVGQSVAIHYCQWKCNVPITLLVFLQHFFCVCCWLHFASLAHKIVQLKLVVMIGFIMSNYRVDADDVAALHSASWFFSSHFPCMLWPRAQIMLAATIN